MEVEIVVPEDYMGDVIGHVNAKRGEVRNMTTRATGVSFVTAILPLANMFGYVGNLRGMSQGRAQFVMQFDHYEEVPRAESDKIIAQLAG